jgi:hypothetical protein
MWDEQITQVRLYELAKRVVPLDEKDEYKSLSEGLEGLKAGIVEHDTWQTFMRFNNLWHSVTRFENPASPMKNLLPKINYELRADEEEKPSQDQIINSKIEDTQTVLRLLNRKINVLISDTDFSRNVIEGIATGLIAGGGAFIFGSPIRYSVGVAIASAIIICIRASRISSKKLKKESEY